MKSETSEYRQTAVTKSVSFGVPAAWLLILTPLILISCKLLGQLLKCPALGPNSYTYKIRDQNRI